jgi:hypothetical protein
MSGNSSLDDTNFETIFAQLDELQKPQKIKEAVSLEFIDSMFVSFERFTEFLIRTKQISILKALAGDAIATSLRRKINQLEAIELTKLVEMFTEIEDVKNKIFNNEDQGIYGLCLHYTKDKDSFDVDKFFADLNFINGSALAKP